MGKRIEKRTRKDGVVQGYTVGSDADDSQQTANRQTAAASAADLAFQSWPGATADRVCEYQLTIGETTYPTEYEADTFIDPVTVDHGDGTMTLVYATHDDVPHEPDGIDGYSKQPVEMESRDSYEDDEWDEYVKDTFEEFQREGEALMLVSSFYETETKVLSTPQELDEAMDSLHLASTIGVYSMKVAGKGATPEMIELSGNAYADENTDWANGRVWGISSATFNIDPETGVATATEEDEESTWGVVGSSHAEDYVKQEAFGHADAKGSPLKGRYQSGRLISDFQKGEIDAGKSMALMGPTAQGANEHGWKLKGVEAFPGDPDRGSKYQIEAHYETDDPAIIEALGTNQASAGYEVLDHDGVLYSSSFGDGDDAGVSGLQEAVAMATSKEEIGSFGQELEL